MLLRFGSLDFLTIVEGELAWANASSRPPPATNLYTIVGTLTDLRLSSIKPQTAGSMQLFDVSNGAFGGSWTPSREDLCYMSCSRP